MKNLKEYLLQRCEKRENGCWEWLKARTSWGYGCFRDGNKVLISHKESYKAFVGSVPKGLFVCHHCDNRSCINPDHLFLGTQQDNMDDMIRKGRSVKPIPQYNNNYNSKRVMADNVEYPSYCAAARALGVSDNGIRKRIQLGWDGYMKII